MFVLMLVNQVNRHGLKSATPTFLHIRKHAHLDADSNSADCLNKSINETSDAQDAVTMVINAVKSSA